MDKKTMIENLVRDAHEKGGFSGTWLYAEKGEIVSKGAIGVNDIEKGTPITEDMVFDLASVRSDEFETGFLAVVLFLDQVDDLDVLFHCVKISLNTNIILFDLS